MKILHINTFDTGGAANAVIRLHKELLNNGIESSFLTLYKTRNDIPNHFIIEENLKPFLLRNYPLSLKSYVQLKFNLFFNNKILERNESKKPKIINGIRTFDIFTFADTNIRIDKSIFYRNADIIQLNWISDFLDWHTFFKYNTKPVIWALHDENAYMGGYHYDIDKTNSPKDNDFLKKYDNIIYKTKEKALAKLNSKLYITTASQWHKNKSSRSQIFKNIEHFVINFGINSSEYCKISKEESRNILGLSKDDIIFLFLGDLFSYRKGFHFIRESKDFFIKNNLKLLITSNYNDIPFKNIINIGFISDSRLLSLAYSASNAILVPSMDETFGNIIIESHLCGTPVIGFPVGGIQELVIQKFNGLLTDDISSISLQKTLNYFLEIQNIFNSNEIRKYAIEKYNVKLMAKKYIDLYQQILK